MVSQALAACIGHTAAHVGDHRLHRAGPRRAGRGGSLGRPGGRAATHASTGCARRDRPAAGNLAAGPGGRLVMRLLAVTAGADAQGRITEAEEIVGRITVDGTIGFVVFTGLFFGPVSAAAYLLLRRWLPAGRAGGLAFGALLLVVAGTRLEPLRRANPDFDLVGPGWVSVVAFTMLVLFHGMLVAALAGRLSRAVPLLAARPGAIAVHAPLLLLVLPGPLVTLVLVAVGVLVVLVSRIPSVVAAVHARPLVIVGRVALAMATLVAFPGFASALLDISSRP